MSRFNTPKVSENLTVNLAGGSAYKLSPKEELISIVLTSFLDDQYYRSSQQTMKRVEELVKLCGPEFSAKAAVYARHEFGMRSITHYIASRLEGDAGKEFYAAVIRRPDDITEILSCRDNPKSSKMTSAMKKGLALAFSKFDGYQIAKYKQGDKLWSMVDAVNVLHPRPTEKSRAALEQLVKGTLKQTGTWEDKLSEAGKGEDKEQKKADAWGELVASKKMGYLALLRNIRNIAKANANAVPGLCASLTNRDMIIKSLVFPFQILGAYEVILNDHDIPVPVKSPILMALDTAIGYSCENVPRFPGNTLVACDTSGSMQGNPWEKASVTMAVFVKSQPCDVITFSNGAYYCTVNPNDTVSTIRKSVRFINSGTNFDAIFTVANKRYDRILVLSDMQSWMHYDRSSAFKNYKKKFDANPWVYCFDYGGYGTGQFIGNRIVQLSGYSDKVFNFMKHAEEDKDIIVNTINNVDITKYLRRWDNETNGDKTD